MNTAGVYKRREPEKTDFYKIVFNYHEEYEKVYPERLEKEYGYLRKRVIEVVHKFLDCGILEHGMARVYCRECGSDFFLAFSCKTRFLCPSCTQKRKRVWTEYVKNHVLENIPHRHWIFTIPRVLRKLFYKDRSLLGHLATCAKETLSDMFKAIYSGKGYMLGIILSIQTRYYGYYSNAARGKRKKLGIETELEDGLNVVVDFINDSPSKKTCRKSWRQLIYKIYEVDPLQCPHCGSDMTIIAFIQSKTEIINILKYLNLWPIEYPQPPPENSILYAGLLLKMAASKYLN